MVFIYKLIKIYICFKYINIDNGELIIERNKVIKRYFKEEFIVDFIPTLGIILTELLNF